MRSVKEIRGEIERVKRAVHTYRAKLERAEKRLEELKNELIEALTQERTGKK